MTRSPITIDDLQELVSAGRLTWGSGIELVAGVVLAASAPSDEVVRRVTTLASDLSRLAPDHRVAVREALTLGPHDLLRPEVAVLRPVWTPSRSQAVPLLASGQAVALAVFVGPDEGPLRWRAQRCARAGVREAWTLGLTERSSSRWRAPMDGRYGLRDPLLAGQSVSPDAFPGRAVVPW